MSNFFKTFLLKILFVVVQRLEGVGWVGGWGGEGGGVNRTFPIGLSLSGCFMHR